jgi:hypothetical protein
MLQYRPHPRLLQHDLRNPNPIWIVGFSPRQIATVRVVPEQQPATKRSGGARISKFVGVHAELLAFYRTKVSSWIVTLGLQLCGYTGVLTAPEAKGLDVWRVASILLVCGMLAGCGGRGMMSGMTPSPSPDGTSPTSSPAPPPATDSTTPTAVRVSPGQSVSGVDVVVVPSASPIAPNIENLGVNPVSGQGMASNTGGSIHRGSTMRILLFGPSVSSGMKVTIAGPSDISISNVQGITATDNTPGLAFMATVASNASLGARTVFLRSSNGDIASFTGGLEVIP